MIAKIKKLVLYFIENIGYSQRGREGISGECIFFLLLREISLELNYKRFEGGLLQMSSNS